MGKESLQDDSLRDPSSKDPGTLIVLGTPDTPKTEPATQDTILRTSNKITVLVLKTLLNDSDTEDTSARISVIIKPDETLGKQKEEKDNSFMENKSNRVVVIVLRDKISGEQKEGRRRAGRSFSRCS